MDELVEKFNSTLQSMIAKSTDPNGMEWLPLLLFAYWFVVQDSTKESPFFLVYGHDPRLPTGILVACYQSCGHGGLSYWDAKHSEEDTWVGYGEYP